MTDDIERNAECTQFLGHCLRIIQLEVVPFQAWEKATAHCNETVNFEFINGCFVSSPTIPDVLIKP